ncbi:MAG: aminotransferase class III-fold pyridoxal phosphate-dependent enzyme [Actinobacteria bacterium]|nr:aminotransferase class III-fold pyridoxal phosphate-dependent enzyme [Actinomycetota bacterium]
MTDLESLAPSLDARQLDSIRSAYGIAISEQVRLPSEVDEVTQARDESGRRYVIKVSAPDGLAGIRWQHRLLELVEANPALSAPRVNHTLDGADLLECEDGRILRVYDWLEGRMLADLDTHSPTLLREWGAAAAELVTTFEHLEPPAEDLGTHRWEVARSAESVATAIEAVTDPEARRLVETIMAWFGDWAEAGLASLPRGVVHQDLNDFNLLAAPDDAGQMRLTGVLDFSDSLNTVTIAELAIAVAYAMPRRSDPLAAAMQVVAGYADRRPLSDVELAAVYPLAAARLCVNAVTWTQRRATTATEYGEARMRHTWPTLELISRIPPRLATAALREAAGRAPTPWRPRPAAPPAPVLGSPAVDVDLSPGSRAFDEIAVGEDPLASIRAAVPIGAIAAGRHLTARFGRLVERSTRRGEAASLRLGVDLWAEPGSPVSAPAPGIVEAAAGGALTLAHPAAAEAEDWWSTYTGIDATVAPGDRVEAGERIGAVAATGPLGVAVFDDRDLALLAPEFVHASMVGVWHAVSPDPSELLGVGARPGEEAWDLDRVVTARRRHFARSQRAYYAEPINLVRGSGATLIDDLGRTYLDAINNVTHVGHANPAVVAATARQSRRLNTNSRFVYASLARYAERLASLLPDPLEVVFLVCTGSEANDLALRISRQVSGREDVMIIDGAYHGNTTAVTAISPNRYKGPGGGTPPPTTHEVMTPDRYRGPFGYVDADAGRRYAADVARVAGDLEAAGRAPAAFFAESLMGTAGTIVHPDGYLAEAFAAARAVGALCVSDEVQVGFGRLGAEFWGFAAGGVVPDIVTMGKPIGNGYPLAAVVTTRAIADAFDQGMKYFNTFGGNPVACEVGMAVLDEIEGRDLQRHAAVVGAHFKAGLEGLAARHAAIGDVRGVGLYLGVDLVRDPETREPDKALAQRIGEQMKDEGVIVIPTGIHDNVLKLKPPLVFSEADADRFVATLDRVLSDRW